MDFEGKITIGDLLTILSIVGGFIGYLVSSAKDRKLSKRQYADGIRSASASSLSGIDRAESLIAQFHDDIQALITNTDLNLVKTKDVVAARDFFWAELHEARSKRLARLSDEKLEVAYAPLLSFTEKIYVIFRSAIARLKDVEETEFHAFLENAQDVILTMAPPFESADLGNPLRSICAEAEAQLKQRLEVALTPVRTFLLETLRRTDDEIFESTLRP